MEGIGVKFMISVDKKGQSLVQDLRGILDDSIFRNFYLKTVAYDEANKARKEYILPFLKSDRLKDLSRAQIIDELRKTAEAHRRAIETTRTLGMNRRQLEGIRGQKLDSPGAIKLAENAFRVYVAEMTKSYAYDAAADFLEATPADLDQAA